MLFKKKIVMQLIFTVSIFFIPMFLGATEINEFISIKKDGYGNVSFSYMEKEATVKENNFLIGNLPFSKEKIDEYFTSPKTKLISSKIENNEKDKSMIQVTVSINFNNINDLNEIRAFSKNPISITQSDSGIVVRNQFTQEFIKTNSVKQIYYSLKPESNIKSYNGQIKDNSVYYFVGKEFMPKGDINFVATLESEVKKGKNNAEEDKGKSCGLFGIELPLVLFGGLVFALKNRSKQK